MADIQFSVLMPTYNQCAFIRRAILSLMQQTYKEWELIIINDGCTDETEEFIADYLEDPRVTYIKNEENTGLGHALNQGLDAARYDYIAYLPSDDYYFPEHLLSMKLKFQESSIYNLIYSGVKYDTADSLHGVIDSASNTVKSGFTSQLVQVCHKKVAERWIERAEWVGDDLFSMYWRKLISCGFFAFTESITCYWTQHPRQRFRIINEKYGGGINKVRSFYHIKHPIKIKVSKEKFIDEEKLYAPFREDCPQAEDSLKILLVGELAYNPERIYALEQAGHKLYGLWMPAPNLSFSTVGPLPFGHVEDLDITHWQDEIRRVNPDIIYGLLNWGAIGFVYDVVRAFPNIPYAWHYKEGPQLAISMGNWPQLLYLYKHASVRIYLNETVKQWFSQFLPSDDTLTMVMDGDLPKKDYFKDSFSEKLSSKDGEIHTVCAGRLIGLGEEGLQILSSSHIHVHLYLENFHASHNSLFRYYLEKFPKYFHLHHHCSAGNWTHEFSQYDAAWLHNIKSLNEGNLMQTTWDDLNIPARISTYMAAGLPVIQQDNSNNIVAVEDIVRRFGIGIQFQDYMNLAQQLRDVNRMRGIKDNVMRYRYLFSFDSYVPELIDTFKKAIAKGGRHSGGTGFIGYGGWYFYTGEYDYAPNARPKYPGSGVACITGTDCAYRSIAYVLQVNPIGIADMYGDWLLRNQKASPENVNRLISEGMVQSNIFSFLQSSLPNYDMRPVNVNYENESEIRNCFARQGNYATMQAAIGTIRISDSQRHEIVVYGVKPDGYLDYKDLQNPNNTSQYTVGDLTSFIPLLKNSSK